jgi:hypothetical protein
MKRHILSNLELNCLFTSKEKKGRLITYLFRMNRNYIAHFNNSDNINLLSKKKQFIILIVEFFCESNWLMLIDEPVSPD